uniref:Cadherin domain-containing protein n=1 Tax=Acanthochromis polyacanthus TaxID=80966 RepID=A0A3Q1FB08_9TELE
MATERYVSSISLRWRLFCELRQVGLLMLLLHVFNMVGGQIRYSIPEEMKKDSVIGNVAQDLGLDLRRLRSGRARIVTGENVHYTELKTDKGILVVNERIDREQLCGDVTPCNVTVLDVNDNVPVFNQSVYKASVVENTMTGTSIITVNAMDADSGSNGIVTYSLSKMKGSAADVFSIDEQTGAIYVSGQIDYDKNKRYEVRVEAKDQGGLTGTSKVIFEVIDVNDNAPVINVMSFSSPVSEDSPPGTTIAILNVKDADSERNGEIQCSIEGKLPFKIESSLTNYYNLISDQHFDRESVSEYNITITATDSGSPPLSSSTKLHLKISDVNDNAPLFDTNSYSAYITENNSPGFSIFAVSQLKSFALYVSQVLYKGILVVNERIDREQLCGDVTPCSFSFEVILENPMELHRITVEVLDINDHAPVFPNKDKPISFEVSESAVVGVQFPLQSAEDLDVDQNGLQDYILSPNDNFILKQHTNPDGSKYVEMVLQKPLDREQRSHLSLKLIAVDGGTPQRSGTVNIDVTVLDANDNIPVFNQSVYKASVVENTVKGTRIITVNATDADSGLNGLVTYSLSKMKGSRVDIFSIDEHTGTIYVSSLIDFEKEKKYEVKVEAKDQGGLIGTSKVIIEVIDVNDNAPVINVMSFSSPVSEDSPPGTTIAILNVKDADSERNGEIKCSTGEKLPFKIESSLTNYYNLVSDQHFDRESVSEYNITITATDSGSPPLSTEASFRSGPYRERRKHPVHRAEGRQRDSGCESENRPRAALRRRNAV